MLTISNENAVRVWSLVDKNTGDALDKLQAASVLLHDTGDVDSDTLDNAMSHLKCAVDMVTRFRENELGDHL